LKNKILTLMARAVFKMSPPPLLRLGNNSCYVECRAHISVLQASRGMVTVPDMDRYVSALTVVIARNCLDCM